MIKVMIVDDHQMFVDGLKALLQLLDDIVVVGEANNGRELMSQLENVAPDIILMDVNMPEMSGIDCTRKVIENYPEIRVLMITMHDSSEYITKLLKAGAHGYILKNTGKNELQEAMSALMRGESYYSKRVTESIMDGLQNKKQSSSYHENVQLTEREKDVLKLIVEELTTHEIAEKLFISHHTVESHRKNLISKLHVKNIAGLVRYAIHNGLVE